MEYVALVMILALLEYVFFMAMVGKARGQYDIKAPATTGNENFERVFRVQQNTLEQLIIFLPSVYLFGLYIHALTAAGLGVIFLAGRLVYYRGYVRDPSTRGAGMIIGFLANVVLLLGSLVGVILALVKSM